MTTMNVLDSAGAVVAIEKPLVPGRAADVASRPVALSNEDVALLGGVTEAAPATDTASSGLNGRLQRIAQNLSALTASVQVLVTGTVLAAGSALIGRAVADASAATGGIASTARMPSAAASTNATSAKASAGRIYAIQGYNAAGAVRYLKFYNKASAPTVGTDTPIKTLALPPAAAFAFDFPVGYSFATGIAFALTTGSADADTGALTAGDVLGLNVDYV